MYPLKSLAILVTSTLTDVWARDYNNRGGKAAHITIEETHTQLVIDLNILIPHLGLDSRSATKVVIDIGIAEIIDELLEYGLYFRVFIGNVFIYSSHF